MNTKIILTILMLGCLTLTACGHVCQFPVPPADVMRPPKDKDMVGRMGSILAPYTTTQEMPKGTGSN